MIDLRGQPWFDWSIALIVGLPIVVLILSEVHLRLQRKGNALAKPVNLLRIWLLPLTALLILLAKGSELSDNNAGVRVVATLVGVIAVTVALGGLNAVLFGNATEGTWRDRLPSIFIDLARLILIVTGAAIVAAYVWDLNVGGLFAALGVGSIVIGLALQNAIGSVVSGLLLLFEQPFSIGDTLEVGGTKGKVVEMNWRSTHLDAGGGIQIIPNATIAGASFSNLSRPTPAHDLVVETSFDASDPPHVVMQTLRSTAQGVPFLRAGSQPVVRVLGAGNYSTTLPLVTAGDSAIARTTFLTWLWYASRRDEISLDGKTFVQRPEHEVVAATEAIAPTLELAGDEQAPFSKHAEIETYGQGEHLVRAGVQPGRLGFIVSGEVRINAMTDDGASIVVRDLSKGEIVGIDAYLRQPAATELVALTEVEVLQIETAAIDGLVRSKPAVARRLQDLIETGKREVARAFESINQSEELTSPVVPRRMGS